MEAFIEGIGERYLIGKANAVPAQLENLARKQFSSTPDIKAQAKQGSGLPSEEKDEEIARLRQQLTKAKLSKDEPAVSTGAPSVKSAPRKKNLADAAPEAKIVKRANKLVAEAKPKKSGGSAYPSSSNKATREMKGLIPLSVDETGSTTSKASPTKLHPHDSEALPTRSDRRASTSTAHRNGPIIANSGEARDKIPAHEDLESLASSSLGASHAGAYRKSGAHKAASTAPSAHAPSITSTRRGRSIGKRSEIGSVSEAASIAPSAHGGNGRRGHSAGRGSKIGSRRAASVDDRPPSHMMAPIHTVVADERRLVPVECVSYEDEEPGLYVVEVEEDPRPRRAKSLRNGGRGVPDYAHQIARSDGEDSLIHVRPVSREVVPARKRVGHKNIVELESGHGRTLYRVS